MVQPDIRTFVGPEGMLFSGWLWAKEWSPAPPQSAELFASMAILVISPFIFMFIYVNLFLPEVLHMCHDWGCSSSPSIADQSEVEEEIEMRLS